MAKEKKDPPSHKASEGQEKKENKALNSAINEIKERFGEVAIMTIYSM